MRLKCSLRFVGFSFFLMKILYIGGFNKDSHTHKAPTLKRRVSSPPNLEERDSLLSSTYPIMKSIPLCNLPKVLVMLI